VLESETPCIIVTSLHNLASLLLLLYWPAFLHLITHEKPSSTFYLTFRQRQHHSSRSCSDEESQGKVDSVDTFYFGCCCVFLDHCYLNTFITPTQTIAACLPDQPSNPIVKNRPTMFAFLATAALLLTTTPHLTSATPLAKRNIGGVRLCDQTNWQGNCWYGIVPLNDCIVLNALYVHHQVMTISRSTCCRN
jgi:hypothetical protein